MVAKLGTRIDLVVARVSILARGVVARRRFSGGLGSLRVDFLSVAGASVDGERAIVASIVHGGI